MSDVAYGPRSAQHARHVFSPPIKARGCRYFPCLPLEMAIKRERKVSVPKSSRRKSTSWQEELKKSKTAEEKKLTTMWLGPQTLVTPTGYRKLLEGEVARVVEKSIEQLGPARTPLQVALVYATTPGVPWDIQHEAIRTVIPYVHAKKAPAFEQGSKTPIESAQEIKAALDAIDETTQGDD